MTKLLLPVLILLILISNSFSQEDLGEIEVIGISPLPGIEIDRNRVPNSNQTIKSKDLETSFSTTFVDIMGKNYQEYQLKMYKIAHSKKMLIIEDLLPLRYLENLKGWQYI